MTDVTVLLSCSFRTADTQVPPPPPRLIPTPLLYLKPLPVRLHLEHHARVRLGESVSVRDSPAGHSQLHFGQAWGADEAQRGFCRLVDVTHAEHTITR